jgi:hypothetical protein
MALKTASDKLSFTHTKAKATPTYTTSVEVRLTSGDVDSASRVEWSALSSEKWLRLGSMRGTVDSNDPVAEIPLTVSALSLNDTAFSGSLRATITVSSRIANRSDLFENGTQTRWMDVEVSINAAPYVTDADVTVQTSSGEILSNGSEVTAGDTLTVVVVAVDFERLPISRAGMQVAGFVGSQGVQRPIQIQHRQGNTYRGEIPSSWIDKDGGEYRLVVGTPDTSVAELRFVIVTSSRSLYVGIVIALVRLFCHARSHLCRFEILLEPTMFDSC